MKPTAWRLAAGLTMLVWGAAAANALEPSFKSLQATSTAISGYGGRLDAVELDGDADQGVFGLWSRERLNRPCQLAVLARNLDGNATAETPGAMATACTTGSPMLRANFTDNPRYFVRGVQVCSSKTSGHPRRMKGFRIVAAKVWQTERRLDALATTATDTRPNCDGDWHATVYCDEGHVASGVNVYWDQEEDAIVGLGLRCRRVAWRGSTS